MSDVDQWLAEVKKAAAKRKSLIQQLARVDVNMFHYGKLAIEAGTPYSTVYALIPFSDYYTRQKMRDMGLKPGKPGIKPRRHKL